MVEIEIGVLRGQCLDRRIDDSNRLISEIAAWEQQRNAAGAPIKWMFTTEKARAKMGRAYPVTSKAVQVAGGARQEALSNAWGRTGIWRPKEQSKRAQARSVYEGRNRSAQPTPGVAAAISKTRARHRITEGYRFCI
jgi:hypothetical protein